MRYALLFPGQGAQEVGMGKSLYESHPAARRVFEEADRALGYSLTRIIFEGPEEELTRTENAQPAILTVSIATKAVLESELGSPLSPALVAGHSLGEYTALVAAGTLGLEDGVRLVHLRGKWMQEAVPVGEGAMADILGLDAELVKRACDEAGQGQVCSPANFNAPGQIVISGHKEAVARAVEIARSLGAKRAIPLKVSAPFHCSLMEPVAERLQEAFARCAWKEPSCPLVNNVSATPLTRPEEIREALCKQTYSPVLWLESVKAMEREGISHYLEIGPGNVLSGLVRKSAGTGVTLDTSTTDGLSRMIALLKGKEGVSVE
ncbi:MAG: ACP S-malonyltransferase [Synergistaceae bacterium]|nr:ACP S-malonyltransferase [Synergistaceae bacterium]